MNIVYLRNMVKYSCLYLTILQFSPIVLNGQILFGEKENGDAFTINIHNNEKQRVLPNNYSQNVIQAHLNYQLVTTGDTLTCKLYKFGNKKLIIKYDCRILIENEKIKWHRGNYQFDTICVTRPQSSQVEFIPIFANDFSKFVWVDVYGPMFFGSDSNVGEMNLENGESHLIKSNAKDPQYSRDCNYVLMKSSKNNNRYYVYSCNEKKIIHSFKKMKRMYWLN